MAFDIEGARKAGYSEAEIADYLGQSSKFDISGARKAGYSDAEIISHLGVKSKKQETPGVLSYLNPATLLDIGAGHLAGAFGAEEDKKQILQQAEERLQRSAQSSGLDTVKGIGAAGLDIVGGIPGMIGGAGVGLYEKFGKGKSTAEALEAGKQFASEWTPSTLLGFDTSNPAYQGTMTPLQPIMQAPEAAGKVVGAGAGALGASPETQQSLAANTEALGLLGMTALGGKGLVKATPKLTESLVERFKKTPEEKTIPVDKEVVDFAVQRELSKQGELPVEQRQPDITPAPESQQGMYGVKPSELVIDENGIPIRKAASEEVMATEHGGDLFSQENLRREEVRRNVNEWEQPSIPSKEYLKQQEIEQAYAQKAIQERAPVKEEPVAEPSQRGQGYQPELQEINPDTGIPSSTTDIRPAKPLDEVTVKPAEKIVEGPQDVLQLPRESRRTPAEEQIFKESQKSPTFPEYQQKIQESFPDATPQEIKAGWDKQQTTVKLDAAKQALSNIPGLDKELSAYRDVPREEALSYVKASPDAESPTLGFKANQFFSRGRLGFEKIQNDGVRNSLAYLVSLKDKASIAANTRIQEVTTGLKKLETLLGQGRAADVFKQRLEGQGKPDYQFKLDSEQAKVNQLLQKNFDDIHASYKELTGKDIPKLDNYMPAKFTGKWAVELRDANGRLLAFITEDSRNSVNKAAEYVASDLNKKAIEAGESAPQLVLSKPKFREEMTSQAFMNRGGLAPYFESYMDLLSSNDPLVQRAQESVQNLVAKRAMDTRQFKKHLEHKAGILGAEGEKPWKTDRENYYDAKKNIENYFKGFEEWKANKEAAKYINDVKETTGPSNTYNILQNYFDDIRAKTTGYDKFANELSVDLANWSGHDISGIAKSSVRGSTNFMTKIWLGFYNVAAGAQNTLQPMWSFPKLVDLAVAGGSKDVVTPIIFGYAKSLLVDVPKIAANKVLGKELSERTKYMTEHEVIKPGLVESQSRTKGGNLVEKGLVVGGQLATEALGRATTFNIFETYLKNSGYSETAAREMAKNLTHEYQVNYEQYAKPGMLANSGFAGEMFGKLQSFKMNQLTQFANYWKTFERTKNPAPFAAALAISVGMAGVTGMIGMDIAEGLYGFLVSTGALDADVPSPRQLALKLGGTAAFGLPTAITGQYLSGSLSSNIIGDMSWRSLAPVLFGAVEAGKQIPNLVKMGYEKFTGEDTMLEREKGGALLAFTPASIRGLIENKYLTDKAGNVVSAKTGKVLYTKNEVDNNLLNNFTNLRSSRRGATASVSSMLQQQEQRIDEKRSDKLHKLQGMVDESVRGKKPLNEKEFNKQIQEYIDMEGNPKTLKNALMQFVRSNGLGDYLSQQINNGKVNISNINKKQRALEYQQAIPNYTITGTK